MSPIVARAAWLADFLWAADAVVVWALIVSAMLGAAVSAWILLAASARITKR